MLSYIRGPRLHCSCLANCFQFALSLLLHICSLYSYVPVFFRSRSALKFVDASRAHCRLHLYHDWQGGCSEHFPAGRYGPDAKPVPAPNPVLSPSSDETTEAALEESAPAPSSPADEAPPVSVAVPAEGESGSGASSPPPDAWAAILSFLDRPQEARQSALVSLPTSDLIRLSLEASATALGRLSWYEGAPASVSGDPIRNPPPGRLVLRAAPVAKEPPPKAMAPSPARETAQVKEESSDAAPAPPPDSSSAQPVAIPKICPIPFPGLANGAVSYGAAPEPGQPGSSDDPGLVSAPSQTTRPKARQPDPAPRAAPEVVPDDSDDDSLWEAAWYGQLDPGHLGPNQYAWIDVRPHLPPLLRNPP